MTELQPFDVDELAENIWVSTFGIPLIPAASQDPLGDRRLCTGLVHITGDWNGAVVLRCSEAIAKRGATLMFEMPAGEVTNDDIRDVVCELSNMTGGTIKSVLPGTCFLSLPTFVEGNDYRVGLPANCTETEHAYQADGEPVLIRIIEAPTRVG